MASAAAVLAGPPHAARGAWPASGIVAAVVAGGVLLSGRVPEAALLVSAVAIGLPHGAIDVLAGERAFRASHGRGWRQAFFGRYLALVAATLATWGVWPAVAAALFLLLSCVHFGATDAPAGPPLRALRVLTHGGAIIVVPATFHTQAIGRLLAVLAPADGGAIATLLSGPAMAAWAAAALASLVIYAQRRNMAAAVDLVLVSLLFALASPLVAFSLYFALIHTPRAWAASIDSECVPARRLVAPTALALGLGAAILLTGRQLAPADDVVRAAFVLLAALTVPHMWLEWRLRRDQAGRRRAGTWGAS